MNYNDIDDENIENEADYENETDYEEMPGKKTTIILMIIVVVLLVAIGVVGGILVFGKGTTIVNNINEVASNRVENEVKNIVSESNSDGKNEREPMQEIVSINDGSNTDEYSQGMKKIKECLKDDQWIKNNVMMKQNCFGESITGTQKLNFMILGKTKATDEPIIIVQAEAEEALSYQLFIVSYKNGKVISNPVEQGGAQHINHGGMSIDPNNRIIVYSWMHMGDSSVTFSSIQFNRVTRLDRAEETYEGDYYVNGQKCSKEKFDDACKKYSKYKFYSVGTELNDANVDKYILF